jgi:hypothetical protein
LNNQTKGYISTTQYEEVADAAESQSTKKATNKEKFQMKKHFLKMHYAKAPFEPLEEEFVKKYHHSHVMQKFTNLRSTFLRPKDNAGSAGGPLQASDGIMDPSDKNVGCGIDFATRRAEAKNTDENVECLTNLQNRMIQVEGLLRLFGFVNSENRGSFRSLATFTSGGLLDKLLKDHGDIPGIIKMLSKMDKSVFKQKLRDKEILLKTPVKFIAKVISIAREGLKSGFGVGFKSKQVKIKGAPIAVYSLDLEMWNDLWHNFV